MRRRAHSRRSDSSYSPPRDRGGDRKRRHASRSPSQSRRGEPDSATPQPHQPRTLEQPGGPPPHVDEDRERWERERERGGSRGARHYRNRSNSPGAIRNGGRGRRYSEDSIDDRQRSRGRDQHHRGREYDARENRDHPHNHRDHRDDSRDRDAYRDSSRDRRGFRDRMDEPRRDEWNDDAGHHLHSARHPSFDDRRSDANNPDARFEEGEGGALATSLVPSPHTDPAVEPLLSFDKWARSGGSIQPLGPGADPMMPIEVRYERYVDQWEERRNEFFVRDHEDEDWFKEKYTLESLLMQKDEHDKRVHSEAEVFASKLSTLPWLEATKRNVDVVGKQNSSKGRKRRDRDRDGEEVRRDFDVIGDEYDSAHIVYIPRVPASVSRELLASSLKEVCVAMNSEDDSDIGSDDAEAGEIELLLSETIQHYRNDKHIRSAWALCPTAAIGEHLIKHANLAVTIPGEDDEDDDDDDEDGAKDEEKSKDGGGKRARVGDKDDSNAASKPSENGNTKDADDTEEAERAEKRAARRRRARRGSSSKGKRSVSLTLDIRRRLPNRMCPVEASHPARIIKDLRLATQLANQLDEAHELEAEHRLASVIADDAFAAISDPVIDLARTLASSSKKESGSKGKDKDEKEAEVASADGDKEEDKAAKDPLVVYLTDCKKLDITLMWLRRVHLVCYYSGTRFSSRGAMLQACSVPFVRYPLVPGVTDVDKAAVEAQEGIVSAGDEDAAPKEKEVEEEEEGAELDLGEKSSKNRKKETTTTTSIGATAATTQGTVANKAEMKRLKALLMDPRELQRKSQQSDGGRGGDRDRDRRGSSWLVRWFETLDRGIERMLEESSNASSKWVKDQQAADEAKLVKLKADAVAAFCKENTKAEDANFRCLLPPYKLFRTVEFVESYIRRKHKDRLALVENLASKAMASEICKREARQRRVDEHNRARRGVEQQESMRRGGGGGGGRRGGGPPMFPQQQQPPPFHGQHHQHQPPPFHPNHNHPRPPFHPQAQHSPMASRGGPGGPPGMAFRHPAVGGPGAGPGPGPGGPGPPRGGNAWTSGRRYKDYDAPAPDEKKVVKIQYRAKVDYSDL